MDRIYQIHTQPIAERDFITSNSYFGSCFAQTIAEYVSDEVNRQSDVNFLLDMLERKHMAVANRDENSFVLLPDAQRIYFADSYKVFQRILADLEGVDENDFSHCHNEVGSLLMQLNACFSQQLDTYVDCNDDGQPIPLDEFIRTAEAGAPYYIGGVVGYHS